ncbi:MAG: hypothetical protein GX620_02725 [Chloroflexi bacterium]|nr:hypothetical protein [Chloroflexota bacterium]
MKKILSAALLVFVLAGLGATVTSAQFTSVTSFQVQNLSDQTATIALVFYDASGNEVVAATVTDTIGGNLSKLYTQANNTNLPTGFNGSVVISSDRPVAAIGIQEAKNASNKVYQGTYSGFGSDQASDTFYIPTVMKAFYGYTTQISVQNAGSTNVNVTIAYKGGYTDSVTGLKPGQVHRFDNASTPGMPSGYIGSATVAATGGQVVAMVNQNNVAALQQQTYEGFSAAGAGGTLYTPVLMRGFYGFNTSVQVQNIGAGSSLVEITYSNGVKSSRTIAGGDGFLFTQQNETRLPASWIGSAVITSASEDIVAVVNQQNASTGKAASYNAFANTGTRFVGPNVMKAFYGFNTSVQVQNVGSPTTCTATFSNGTTQTSPTLNQYGTFLFTQQNNAALGSSFIGSVSVTCGGQPMVAIVNQNGPDGAGDNAMAYNAIQAQAPVD